LVNQRLRNHPLYAEYARMRKREKELICEGEELKKAGIRSAQLLKTNRKFARARKTLDEVEKNLSEDKV